jgi:hypothetical protein
MNIDLPSDAVAKLRAMANNTHHLEDQRQERLHMQNQQQQLE